MDALTRAEKVLAKERAIIGKLETTRLDRGGNVPRHAMDSLTELLRLAPERLEAWKALEVEAAARSGGPLAKATTAPCADQYGTVWNVLKAMAGMCNDWDQCLADTYGECEYPTLAKYNPCC